MESSANRRRKSPRDATSGFRRAGCYLAAGLAVAGCSKTPARVDMPEFDADGIAAAAVRQFDRDGDERLSADELTEAPSLAGVLSRLDADDDRLISSTEIAARVEAWLAYNAGLSQASCVVTRKGQPVGGAEVCYQPETFLLDAVAPAFGKTTGGGNAVMSVAEEHRPGPGYLGVQCGFYRVVVTLADGTQVDDLNDGLEVAGDLQNNHHVKLP